MFFSRGLVNDNDIGVCLQSSIMRTGLKTNQFNEITQKDPEPLAEGFEVETAEWETHAGH